jgi:hypothetical protein
MNTKAFNLEKIREALKGAKERCPWQRLIDLGYREWQKPENRNWSYGEMVEQAGETYGEVVKLLILLGLYRIPFYAAWFVIRPICLWASDSPMRHKTAALSELFEITQKLVVGFVSPWPVLHWAHFGEDGLF